jgi:hypothetical protein
MFKFTSLSSLLLLATTAFGATSRYVYRSYEEAGAYFSLAAVRSSLFCALTQHV